MDHRAHLAIGTRGPCSKKLRSAKDCTGLTRMGRCIVSNVPLEIEIILDGAPKESERCSYLRARAYFFQAFCCLRVERFKPLYLTLNILGCWRFERFDCLGDRSASASYCLFRQISLCRLTRYLVLDEIRPDRGRQQRGR